MIHQSWQTATRPLKYINSTYNVLTLGSEAYEVDLVLAICSPREQDPATQPHQPAVGMSSCHYSQAKISFLAAVTQVQGAKWPDPLATPYATCLLSPPLQAADCQANKWNATSIVVPRYLKNMPAVLLGFLVSGLSQTKRRPPKSMPKE